MILPLAVIVTEHLWYYGYMVRNKMLDEVPCGLRAAGEGKGNEKITDHDHTLSEKYYAVVSEHYGNFRSTYHGWNVCGRDCFFLSGNRTLAYESARYKDYNLLMVVSLLSGIIVIVCNMAAQILNERIDPRIRISRQPDIQEVREHE